MWLDHSSESCCGHHHDAEEFVILAAEGFRGESLLLQAAAYIWDSRDGVCKVCGERRNRESRNMYYDIVREAVWGPV